MPSPATAGEAGSGPRTSRGVHRDQPRSILSGMSPPSPSFKLQLAATRQPRPKDSELVFGRTFTDHMAVADWESERGWFDPRVVPYGPFSLDPAAAVFHYAQEMFDGLKAFRGADGKIRFFRLDRHCKRMHDGGERLCIPAIDEALMREAILSLVRADADWVPSSAGTSLYIRPTIIATEPFLGVRPAKRFVFFVIASPVGGYGGEGVQPRAHPGRGQVRARRGRRAGRRQGGRQLHRQPAGRRGRQGPRLRPGAVDRRGRAHYLEEVGTMNLMVRIGDEFVTPPLGGSILSGVTRDSVLTLLRDWGFAAHERPIGMEK